MESIKSEFVVETVWNEVKAKAQIVNKQLVEHLDGWKKSKDLRVYVVEYPFGSKILDKGMLQIPINNKELIPITDQRLPQQLRDDLCYSPVPLGLFLNNKCEVFYESDNRIFSLAYFSPGIVLGLWECLDAQNGAFKRRFWSMTSGARSIFMLPKITETISHHKLMKYLNLRRPVPKNESDHYELFKNIDNSKLVNKSWNTTIIFFSKDFLEENSDLNWVNFHHYLYQEGWKLSESWRNQKSFEVIWDSFCAYLNENNFKIEPYLLNTIKHLLFIGIGVIPGMKAAASNEHGPVSDIQNLYIDKYELKNHLPTIMVPHHLNINNGNDTVYYSLQLPSLLEYFPRKKSTNTILSELKSLKILMDEFLKESLNGNIKVDNTPIYRAVTENEYDFFHTEGDTDGIRNTSFLAQEDPQLLKLAPGVIGDNRTFCDSYGFMRGCVRIAI